jgi:hypothetical protein
MSEETRNIEDLAYAKYLVWKELTFIYKFKAIANGIIYLWRFNIEDNSITPVSLDYEACREGWRVYSFEIAEKNEISVAQLDKLFKEKGID